MAIDPNLLIAAPILQDYFVDKETGEPLVGGIITCFHDNARTTLKNWYYQTGIPGAYTYTQLANPLTLSSVGTIQDPNGNDTIPFWYPYDETDSTIKDPYYVTVYSSPNVTPPHELQFTRSNFPFNPGTSGGATVATNNNLIANNEFWRNIGSIDVSDLSDNLFKINGLNYYFATLAPSQHDGFTMPDITFWKNVNDGTDTVTFEQFVDHFTDQIIPYDITPEFYMNVQCTSAGTSSAKYVQIPIQLHVNSLSGVPNCSEVIAAMAVSGNPTITVQLFQYLGSGVTSPVAGTLQTITLTNSWEKYNTTFTFPSAQAVTLGNGGDDAYYLQIAFQPETTYNINLAKPATYLSDVIPTNDWETYDEINAVISSPRTGNVMISMNDYMFGYVPMNDGSIGFNPDTMATYKPNARNNQDTWPLYYLLWNKFKGFSNGTSNVLAQLLDTSGNPVAYGTDAIGDFNSNKSLVLTQTMAKVILGTVPVESLLTTYSTTFTGSNSGGNLLITADNSVSGLFNGMPIYFFAGSGGALPDAINATTIYYVAGFNGTSTFFLSTSFANAMAGTYIAYVTTSGTSPISFVTSFAGTFEGEYAHTQLEGELAAHNHHSPFTTTGGQNAEAGPRPCSTTGNAQNVTINVPTDGSSTPFNVTQPGAFFNFFMKL